MRLQFGRSALGALAEEVLWNSETPGHDVEVTKFLLSAYGMGVISEVEEKQPIPRVLLTGTGGWILVSDGGLSDDRGGIGFVVARGEEIVAMRSMGIRVHAGSSRAMEWLAKAAMLLMTQELSGDRLSVVDSAAATFSKDGLPEFGTWLDEYVREALRTVDMGSFREGWIEALEKDGGPARLEKQRISGLLQQDSS